MSLPEKWNYKYKTNITNYLNWKIFTWCVTFINYKSYDVIILKVTP